MSYHDQSIGSEQVFDGTVVEVYFDQPLFLSKGSSSSPFLSKNFTWDNSTVDVNRNFLCLGPCEERCWNFPEALEDLIGVFSLDCQGSKGNTLQITSSVSSFFSLLQINFSLSPFSFSSCVTPHFLVALPKGTPYIFGNVVIDPTDPLSFNNLDFLIPLPPTEDPLSTLAYSIGSHFLPFYLFCNCGPSSPFYLFRTFPFSYFLCYVDGHNFQVME